MCGKSWPNNLRLTKIKSESGLVVSWGLLDLAQYANLLINPDHRATHRNQGEKRAVE
jgi:hypothetical protein